MNNVAIEYQCINCLCLIDVKPYSPTTGNMPPKLRCPLCRHICAPKHQLMDEHGLIDRQNALRHWSNCPNAYKCSLYDQYDSDCEDGKLMQKCLVALHAEAECATHFAREAAQPIPRRTPGKAQGKPASKTE